MGIFFLKKKKRQNHLSQSSHFKTEIKRQSGLNQIREKGQCPLSTLLSDIVEVLANGISQEKKIMTIFLCVEDDDDEMSFQKTKEKKNYTIRNRKRSHFRLRALKWSLISSPLTAS